MWGMEFLATFRADEFVVKLIIFSKTFFKISAPIYQYRERMIMTRTISELKN